MMHDLPQQIEQSLSILIGLELRSACRALNLEMFDIGPLLAEVRTAGAWGEVSRYCLEVQCPWRWTSAAGLVTGSEDRHYPPGENPSMAEFDPDNIARCDAILEQLIRGREKLLVVESIAADSLGGLRVRLSEGHGIELFPAHTLIQEFWRLLDRKSQSAIFCTPAGLKVE